MKKILVVEDEVAMQKALNDILAKEGFTVIIANNGKEGLEQATKERPDLILLDLLMPEMDGLTVLRKLREGSDYEKTVPVIVLTVLSADTEEIIKTVAETGPSYYLVKSSLTMAEVAKKVREALRN